MTPFRNRPRRSTNTVEASLNHVTGAARDPFVLTPEYKVVAVAIEKV